MNPSQPAAANRPLPLPSFFMLSIWLLGAWKLWRPAMNGDDLAIFGMLVCVGLGLKFGVQWLNALDECSDRQEAQAALASYSDKQGAAKLGDLADARRAALTTSRGLQLGSLKGQRLSYAGSNHVWITGPPGSGKGTGPFGVTGLTARVGDDPQGDPFSQFWNDPALESFCLLNKRQRELGRRVVVICGEPERLKRELGIEFDAVRVNPATIMDPASDTVVDDARMLAMLVFPGQPPEKRSGNTGHFEDTSRIAIKTHALDELSVEGVVTLPALQRRMAGDQTAVIAAMLNNDAYEGAIAEGAAKLQSILVDSPEEWSGVMSTVARALELYDGFSSYGKSVSNANWDWVMMKQEPTAAFLCNSADRALTHAGHKNLMLGSAIESLARVRTRRRITFYLDECAGLRYLPTLPHAMAEYRKFGQQYVLGWQQFSQAQRIYGHELAREMLGMCEAVLAMNTREPSDCKMLSEMIGSTTQATASQSVDFAPGGGPPKVSYNGSFQTQPVLRPEAIRTLGKDKALLICGDEPALVLDKVSYLKDRRLRRLAGANPYFRKEN
ncbi:Coupling protein TraD [Botrimarina colliarenosi]|uniref:Coupling protein TraD n=1 Tax=Botrimarina colliarenosi TaxID=2528001 RepID=A0A5C6AMX9_9BACT|nr:type IV secretory system conjugative DNA transfer family protein [Botrimarina colliarenosi]TWU00486.1 Coupling protein TraD [Botrimarina colliarenosi]